MTDNATVCEHLAPQHTASRLMNMVASSDVYVSLILSSIQWGGCPSRCDMTGQKLNREQIDVGVPFHQPFMSLLNKLELRQELHLRKRSSTVTLSPLFALAQCSDADLTRYVSEVSPPWPCQLLLYDNVRFSCCFPIAPVLAAASQLHLACFSCCSRQYTVAGLDYWTHPKWCKMPFPVSFNVGEKLIMPIQPMSLLNLLPHPVEATLLESVEVKSHIHV